MHVTLSPASELPPTRLADLLNTCYEDYATPIHFRPDQFEFFVRAHDIRLDQSLVARVGNETIGMALLAQRGERGWVSGLGVMPEHRRQGVARALLSGVMENARKIGAKHLQLEVLSNNQSAIQLYRDMGWEVERELLVWERMVEQGPLPIHRERAQELDARFLLTHYFDAWHQERPCWQREKASLLHYVEIGMKGWAILRDDAPVAYVLGFLPRDGLMPLMDVAVDPAVGYKSGGRAIIQNLHLMFSATTQLPNEPVASQLNFLFVAMAYQVVLRQYEMTVTV